MAKKNLHPCYCPVCKLDTPEVIDVGVNTNVYNCSGCHSVYLGPVWPGLCLTCKAGSGQQKKVDSLVDGEPIPGSTCSVCEDRVADSKRKITEGGVGFKCASCGNQGVQGPETDFSRNIRLDLNKPTPEYVFVRIHECEKCPPKNQSEEVQEIEK